MNNQNTETLEQRVDNLEEHVDMIISDASLEERVETLEDQSRQWCDIFLHGKFTGKSPV